jgi:helicase MOV-10
MIALTFLTSPPWFNAIEASRVVHLAATLRDAGVSGVVHLATTLRDAGVSEADTEIITPNHGHFSKIKKGLKMLHVLFGTAEQFLAQEKEIIIISTVRSTLKHEWFHKVFNLGFLNNHRRFNFVIMCARLLLIIIGNPHIMSKVCQIVAHHPLPHAHVMFLVKLISVTVGSALG